MTRVGFEPTPLTRPGSLDKLYDKVTLPWRLGPLGHLASAYHMPHQHAISIPTSPISDDR